MCGLSTFKQLQHPTIMDQYNISLFAFKEEDKLRLFIGNEVY